MGEARPALPGIDEPTVSAWIQRHADAQPPIRYVVLEGGYSNLTFRLEDAAGRRWVLRRPPLGNVLATAHDMAREYRIQAALWTSPVPVPAMVGLYEDRAVNGAPFYVMEHVEGAVVRTPEDAASLDPASRRRVAHSLIDVLADLHATDVDAIGLGDLARRDGYVERQLKRWRRQLTDYDTREVPLLAEVYQQLVDEMPAQARTALLHGDYRLDNVILRDDRSIAAVLDWELSTLGDPLADLGLTLAYWSRDDDEAGMPAWGTDLPGFPSREELASRYEARSGFDVSDLSYYVAFAHWKVACISEGVFSRYSAGVMGDTDVDMDLLERHPVARAEAAHRILRTR